MNSRVALAFLLLCAPSCGNPAPPPGPPVLDLRPTTPGGFDASWRTLACRISVNCADGSSPSCHEWNDAFDASLYEIDLAAAHACLDAMLAEAESCASATGVGDGGLVATCGGALRGLVPVGGDCSADVGACVAGSSCVGRTCTTPGAAGTACATGAACAAGLSCVIPPPMAGMPPPPGMCVTPPALGEQCDTSDDCQDGLYCTARACQTRSAAGEACIEGACVAGFFCQAGTCVAELAPGSVCTLDAECGQFGEDVLRPCVSDAEDTTLRCRVYGSAAGNACIPDADRDGLEPFCDAGLVCTEIRTIGVTAVGVCVPGRVVGDDCDEIFGCVHGARCVDRVCVATAGHGEACGGGVGCAEWQDCRGGLCVPAPRPGEACTTTCAAGVCSGGTCCLEPIGTMCERAPGDPCDGTCLDRRCQRVDACTCGAGQGCYTDMLNGGVSACGPVCS